MTESPKRFNATFCALPTTIFERMSRMAAETGSINLGQGFPDRELEGPASLKNEVFRSMQEESNQYPPMMGVPALHEAIAAHSSRYCGISLDARTQVLVTLGATEALAAAFLGLLNPGDEVLLFAPLYDSYVPMIRRAGGVPKILTLRPPSWDLPTFEEMEAAITRRTKLVVVNTPHNPTGKVLTVTELESIAALCRRHDLYAVLDEVYQHLVFPGGEHVTLASLDGMVDRCLRIGSAGKTFSFTDFKVGWACGPQDMITAIAKAHQFMTFTVNSALQRAVALGLNQEHDFYRGWALFAMCLMHALCGEL
jgi:aspartate/methionine/tyrosine aminotransferase